MASSPAARDVLENLFLYLDVPSIANCGLVCKMWYAATTENSLWRKVCLRDWPSIKDSALAVCLQPPNLAKDLLLRLHQGSFQYPTLDVKDVEICLDISFKGQPIYSDVLPYSLNLMVNCFDKNLLLPPYEHSSRLPQSFCQSAFLLPLRNRTTDSFPTPPCPADSAILRDYIANIHVSMVAIRKTDFATFQLMNGDVQNFAWERFDWNLPIDNLGFENTAASDWVDWESRQKVIDHAEQSSLIPFMIRWLHWVSGTEVMVADLYLFGNLVKQKGEAGGARTVSVELVDYCLSVRGWKTGGVLIEGDHLWGGRHGLQQLSRAYWMF
eukprot:TRINITY_DN22150_c0_g1_i1.p1 TRINITY_DN22150_c0_g1~~TRINITY_DN22150_c0_g1_i1.p1  ORF type:complete len:326 (+),score=28.24 TRINITY_DN22150_c0_g1_i1:172-1149(+)